MMILAYIILGLLVAIVCVIIALYIGSYIYLMRNPEKVAELRKLAQEHKLEKEQSIVCQVCITMRTDADIMVMESTLSNPPLKIRFCRDNDDCRTKAFATLKERALDWLKDKQIT